MAPVNRVKVLKWSGLWATHHDNVKGGALLLGIDLAAL